MTSASCRFPLPGALAFVALLAFVASAGGPEAARAQTSLYETEVVWSPQGAAEREATFRQALRHVLVKVTGQRRLAEAAEFEPLVENAQGLVQQYQLHTATVPSGETSVQEPRLWVRFDEAGVDRLVREAELPVWGRTRPSVLAWVGVENGGTPRIAGAEGTGDVAAILRRGAAWRGVPLVLPLLDIEDQARIDPSDLRVGVEERVRAASERYQPGGILIGWVERGVLWEGRWSLLLPGATQQWKTEGDVLDLVVAEGVQEAVDALAARYAGAAFEEEAQSAVAVSVGGVHDFAGYARTMRYLESLDEVESVDVLAVVPGRLRLGLKLRGGARGLYELIALGSTLAADAGEVEGALALRLLP